MTDDDTFSLRRIAVPAFGPSLLYGAANGAILPVLALSARDHGASLALSGFVAALVGIGSLLGNIPAAMLAARIGERRAMILAGVLSTLALIGCILSPGVWSLGACVLLVGAGSAVFLLARQTYLTEAVPLSMRARALSTLGGTTRIGVFVGPFAGAAFIHAFGLSGAYAVAAVAMAGAGFIAWASPDLGVEPRDGPAPVRPRIRIVDVMRAHRHVFATLGVGVLLVSVLRASRQVVVPLWAEQLGLEPTTISLVYGLVAAIDMSVFYPAGKVMDQHGRLWVAVPSSVLMGLALIAIPWTHAPIAFVLVCLVLGFGNGIGSGIVMTLAADASPAQGRTQFLGVWRLMSDLGTSGGPALLAAMTSLVSLAAGISVIGCMGLVAAAVFYRWVPRPH
ncbi:MFS transporter [Verticiella sediminum]|uniref:MFS transporter n=1 Tax=Verticiella sediminum TaxID=1247510 RepID=A0A556AY96_9BURK|nr:MFS transporter [Verticiella sediminum]TSH97923.1 MFS transporter [Verticiella sediminum]